ncbi:hypothetical protein AG0111_0g9390 [Alternaria gaisen]|uniref:Uncharacterized protein n=1 Tax=Alternaria gaisen TaxID=167740 RepID=A0ACB6FF78_9PLEO|nr:hypothetical protein AG0111_0g9390 [Alternaria gaisen]
MEFQRGERVNLNFDTGAVEKLDQEEQHELRMPSFPTLRGRHSRARFITS